MFQNLRQRLADKAIRKLSDTRPHKPQSVRLESSRIIGIVYDDAANGPARLEPVLRLPVLQNKRVHIISYRETRPRKNETPVPGTFSVKETNWLYQPRSGTVDEFLGRHYDILIDLSSTDNYPLLYIMAAADAGLKVSLFSEKKKALADLMIRMHSADDPVALFQQMNHYINQFNTPVSV